MIRRFVYPKLDLFYKRRGLDGAEQLAIAGYDDDGKRWFGVKTAIENYCEEYGLHVKNVEWLVKKNPEENDFVVIKATDIDDWVRKFNALDVEFEPMED